MGSLSRGANCARVFLVLFNLIFVLIGLALIVGGGLLKGGAEFLDVLGKFVNQVPGLDNVAIAIIVLGCVIFVIGILGTCGACCSVRCMLVLYAVLVIIITLAEIITIALLFSGKLDKTVTEGFSQLTKKYQMPSDLSKIDTKDIISRLIDAVFIGLKCCDKTHIPKTPPSCCKSLTREMLESGNLNSVQQCFSSQNAQDSYVKECGEALVDIIRDNKPWVIGISVGLVVIELLCITFAFWICHQINQQNKVSSF